MKIVVSLALIFAITATNSPSAPSPVRPAIATDSIYALAVRPSDFPNEPVVYLLDEGLYRVESNGSNTRTTRQVIQILRPEGAARHRERSISYDPSHQTLTVNWMRVLRTNGEVISAEPSHIQDSDVPAAMENPMYVQSKVRRISLSGLDTGTVLDYSITIEDRKPFMEGDFYFGWFVNTPGPVIRSNLVVEVPAGMTPRIVERNLNFKRTERVAEGKKKYTWTTSNVARAHPERYVPDSLQPVMSVAVTPPIDWKRIGVWYAPIARDAYAITPDVEKKISEVTAKARTREDSIRAIHRWVAQDIRYVAIELGRGGYVPRSAEAVVKTGFGDCKDKTMLFLAALRRIGVRGYPVLLNAFASSIRALSPSLGQLNHMIASVATTDGYQFADLTASVIPLGRLPASEAGAVAIIVKENDAEEIRLPVEPVPESVIETSISGTMSDDGTIQGTVQQQFRGGSEASLRHVFLNPPDSSQRAFMARAIASFAFESPEADSLEGFDGKDFSIPATVKVRFRASKALSKVGGLSLFTNPIKPMTNLARIADDLAKQPTRKLPIDLRLIVSPTTTRTELRMKMPAGWQATLPKNESVSGLPGSYEMRYEQSGDELRISRTLTGTRNVAAPDKMPEIIAWLRQVSSDDTKLILLKRP